MERGTRLLTERTGVHRSYSPMSIIGSFHRRKLRNKVNPVILLSVYTKLMVDVSVRKEIVNWPYMYFFKSES